MQTSIRWACPSELTADERRVAQALHRIEDTWNLIGRALNAVVTCAAKAVDRPRALVIAAAHLTLMDHSSLKAALDIDWADPAAQAAALARLLGEVDRIEQWVATQSPTTSDTRLARGPDRIARRVDPRS